ncbi:MAG: hypothetical protein HYT48_00485 [Candidatus Vogelbacteria bacterium]|nr:hypothetical protein [Candidatus Vogelbacteria bacterium]
MNLDTNHFKKKLEREKAELDQDLAQIESVKEAETEFRDEVADQLEDLDERQALQMTLTARLKEVERALEKITAGQYGICEVGGEPIEPERLGADPAARTCKRHLNVG